MKFDLSQFDDVSIYKSEKDIPRPDSSDLHAMSLYDYARARFRLAQSEAHYQATKHLRFVPNLTNKIGDTLAFEMPVRKRAKS